MESPITFENLPQAVQKLHERFDRMEQLLKERGKPPDQPPDKILMTVKELAVFLSISVQSVYTLMHNRSIAYHKKEKLCYFFMSDVLEWLRSGRQKPSEEIEAMANNYLHNKNLKKNKK